MQQIVSIKNTRLRVVHQNEIILLRRQLADMKSQLNEMSKLLLNQAQGFNRIKITDKKGVKFIDESTILYCEAKGNYTLLYVNNEKSNETEKHLISKTLKQVVAMLKGDSFIRTHQSYLINKKFVVQICKQDGMFVLLSNGAHIPVSRRRQCSVAGLAFA